MVTRAQAGSGEPGRRRAVRRARRPELRLPPLTPYEGGLEPDGDHDGQEFAGTDLAGQRGPGSRFLDCLLDGCSLHETELGNARLIDSRLSGVHGVGTDLAGATLRDVEVADARLGGVQMHGATLERVVIRGGKIDFPNLRAAVLKDVVFEGCVLVEPDFADATLERVEFPDCTLRGADLSGVRLTDVDLRYAAAIDIARGVDRLRGAVVTPTQLMELAPAFAAQLGVRVEVG